MRPALKRPLKLGTFAALLLGLAAYAVAVFIAANAHA